MKIGPDGGMKGGESPRKATTGEQGDARLNLRGVLTEALAFVIDHADKDEDPEQWTLTKELRLALARQQPAAPTNGEQGDAVSSAYYRWLNSTPAGVEQSPWDTFVAGYNADQSVAAPSGVSDALHALVIEWRQRSREARYCAIDYDETLRCANELTAALAAQQLATTTVTRQEHPSDDR